MMMLNASMLLLTGIIMMIFPTAIRAESDSVPTLLVCGEQCYCGEQQKGQGKEQRIICNQTSTEPVVLTAQVFPNATNVPLLTYVRVQNKDHVTVTRDFLEKWKQYFSNSLDIWNVKQLVLPSSLPEYNTTERWSLFAGIGIVDSHVDVLPDGLFPVKEKAGFKLIRSSVGILKPNVFRNAKYLTYLTVQDSYIGIMQGSQQTNKLQVRGEMLNPAVMFKNTAVGVVEQGALCLTSESEYEVRLQNVTIGQLATNAVVVSNLKLVINDSKVGDMQHRALDIEERATATVMNSHLIAQPGALNHLPCSSTENHIHSNDILIPEGLSANTENLENDDESKNLTAPTQKQHDIAELTSERLKLALHSTCVVNNIPASLRNYGCQVTEIIQSPVEQQKSTQLLQTGLYSFVAISSMALILVVVLACVLSNTRHRRGRLTTEAPVVMSSLQEDPIYEEPSAILMNAPPAVPPPMSVLYRSESHSESHCLTGPRGGNCGGTFKQPKVENDYMFMK